MTENQTLSTSYNDAKLSCLKTLTTAEEPLVGLLPKPKTEMTESELREFVQEVRTLRANWQRFNAAVGGTRKQPRAAAPKKETLDGYV
jgi:hypothetical protein